MSWDLVIAIAGVCLLIVFVNTADCFEKFKRLIKGGKILLYFPSWAGTKKPLIWYIVWSVIEFIDLPLFIWAAVMGGSTEHLLAAFLLTVPTYIILYEIIYVISIHIKRCLISKKN